MSPYIGKLKSAIAADLVADYTRAGDVVLDPFCGSGTVPLECVRAGRHALASDASEYSHVLTVAKLNPPDSMGAASAELDDVYCASQSRPMPDLRGVPTWVREFFHPKTLRDAIRFADVCIERRSFFLLACFLGILHHQRPGFLSYPSSHLVPYLRDKNFPREQYPDLYTARDVKSRVYKKVLRALSKESPKSVVAMPRRIVECQQIESLRVSEPIDAIITSPPYMNALDYRRDNRLRMWFLDRGVQDYAPEPTDPRAQFVQAVKSLGRIASDNLREGGVCVAIVGETVRRKRMEGHPADVIREEFMPLRPRLELESVIADTIPDVRRSRRNGRATKRELFLVFRKKR